MTNWIEEAVSLGATQAGWLPTDVIRFLPEVRDMCAADKCRSFGRNWGCPPGCGDLAACEAHVKSYKQGLLFTYAAMMEDPFDYEAVQEGAERIQELGDELWKKLEASGVSRLWLLTPGGCNICKKCNYPEPCLHPERCKSSPEGQGMWVSEICKQAGVRYNNGQNSVTYVGVAFFEE